MTLTGETTRGKQHIIKSIGKSVAKAMNYKLAKRVIRSARLTILCDITTQSARSRTGILADEQASEPYFVSRRFSFPRRPPRTPSRTRGVVCLNAKSRHCRSGYLCEHALVKHSSIWPVSRPTSSTRSPRRVSPTHAENHSTPRQENARSNARERKGKQRVELDGALIIAVKYALLFRMERT